MIRSQIYHRCCCNIADDESSESVEYFSVNKRQRLDGYHYLRGPEARTERGGNQLDDDDGVLRLRHVDATQLERARHVRLPVRAVEECHRAETLQFQI